MARMQPHLLRVAVLLVLSGCTARIDRPNNPVAVESVQAGKLRLASLERAAIRVHLQGRADSRLPQRLPQNPIVTPSSSTTLGDNINGPSLIRVPFWIDKPLGRYYLYFSHHAGKFIRLAYADALTGPWKIHEAGTLRIEETARCHDHVASPDVHVDEARREILMYFHCPSGGRVDANGRVDINEQETFFATSSDGLRFRASPGPLGPAYFRVFRWGDYYYSVVRGGMVLRSRDMRTPFEPGPTIIPLDAGRLLRHAAVDVQGDVLRVYYSRIGDRPERILVSEVRLVPDWQAWRASPPADVLTPERDFEGGNLPLEASAPDEAPGRVRQLRDPGIFSEGRTTYLLYSVAGESGLAIAAISR